MKKYILALSLLASLTSLSFSANALTQGASGLVSMTHTNTNTTATLSGIASSSTNAVDVIQPVVFLPKVNDGKISAMGTAVNTIQPQLDTPKVN